jgi:hypothetical protein
MRATLARHAGQPVRLGLRPEHIDTAPMTPSGALTWTATVQRVQLTGPDSHIHLATQTHSFVVRTHRAASLQPDQQVALVADLDQARFFDMASGSALGTEPSGQPSQPLPLPLTSQERVASVIGREPFTG